ncbi:hypothetical protein TNCV_1070261 [Trichonephila clavipes]|nr:hypothetical protein TNCV_1070261 [Trichonephila clavipes]
MPAMIRYLDHWATAAPRLHQTEAKRSDQVYVVIGLKAESKIDEAAIVAEGLSLGPVGPCLETSQRRSVTQQVI